MPHIILFAANQTEYTFAGYIVLGCLGVVSFLLGLHAVATRTFPLAFWDVRFIWSLFGYRAPPVEGNAAVFQGLLSLVGGIALVAVSVYSLIEGDYAENREKLAAEQRARMMGQQFLPRPRLQSAAGNQPHRVAPDGRPNLNPEGLQAEARQNAQQQRQEREADRIRREQEQKSRERERLARERERKGPDPSDPQYYDKLVERMLSADSMHRKDAVEKLLRAEPSQVPSAETRKKIARAFRQLAQEEHNRFERADAVKGLVHWGGKFCVPILLDMLDEEHSSEKTEVYKALGELGDVRAAAPVASRLANRSEHDMAYRCLKKMGAIAEDAVIDMVLSPDPKTCVSAVEILGEIGTKKSLSILRIASGQSVNPYVRFAARRSIKSVIARQKPEVAETDEGKKAD